MIKPINCTSITNAQTTQKCLLEKKSLTLVIPKLCTMIYLVGHIQITGGLC